MNRNGKGKTIAREWEIEWDEERETAGGGNHHSSRRRRRNSIDGWDESVLPFNRMWADQSNKPFLLSRLDRLNWTPGSNKPDRINGRKDRGISDWDSSPSRGQERVRNGREIDPEGIRQWPFPCWFPLPSYEPKGNYAWIRMMIVTIWDDLNSEGIGWILKMEGSL